MLRAVHVKLSFDLATENCSMPFKKLSMDSSRGPGRRDDGRGRRGGSDVRQARYLRIDQLMPGMTGVNLVAVVEKIDIVR